MTAKKEKFLKELQEKCNKKEARKKLLKSKKEIRLRKAYEEMQKD